MQICGKHKVYILAEGTDAKGKALLLCDKCHCRGMPKEIWDQCGKNDLFHLESWGEFHSGVTYELDIEG